MKATLNKSEFEFFPAVLFDLIAKECKTNWVGYKASDNDPNILEFDCEQTQLDKAIAKYDHVTVSLEEAEKEKKTKVKNDIANLFLLLLQTIVDKGIILKADLPNDLKSLVK